MGYVYKYVAIEGQSTTRAYALIDNGSSMTILCDDLAKSAMVQFGQMIPVRNPRGGVSNVWSALAAFCVEHTSHFERIEVGVAPRSLTGEELLLGSDFINGVKTKIDLLTARLRCDYCDQVITGCKCTMKQFSRAGQGPVQAGTSYSQGGTPPQYGPRPPYQG
jgi:hypothetical protein